MCFIELKLRSGSKGRASVCEVVCTDLLISSSKLSEGRGEKAKTRQQYFSHVVTITVLNL